MNWMKLIIFSILIGVFIGVTSKNLGINSWIATSCFGLGAITFMFIRIMDE